MYSNTHKFIFLHWGKCAGSSIKRGLMSIDGLEVKLERGHSNLNMMIRAIKADGFNPDQYFKFTTVRNLWDREVSLYHHMSTINKRHPNDPEKQKMHFDGTFEEFVRFSNPLISPDFEDFDYVVRYEFLQDDFATLCDKLNVHKPELPHIDYGTARPKIDYKSYYHGNLQQIIAEKYAKEIEYFGYKFGE